MHIEIGPAVAVMAPAAAPLLKASFVDRNGFVVQQVDAANPSADGDVWPDTVPVLEFAHPPGRRAAVRERVPAGAGAVRAGVERHVEAQVRLPAERGGDWRSGDGDPGPLDSAWWWSTAATGIVAESVGDMPLSSEEGRWLALLTWDPAPVVAGARRHQRDLAG